MVVGNQATREPHVLGRAKINHNTTQSLQVCFASAKYDSETQPLHNPCCQRRCGNINFAWMANNFGGHQPYHQQHHPRQHGPQCTGESRSVREDFHTLPQSVLVTTAWNNTVPNFDLALGTTTRALQSTNSNERLFGSKSSARQHTTRISHQMFGVLFTRANSAHVEQPYSRIPRRHYREKDDHPKVSPNDNQFMGTCDKNARPTTVQLFARDRRAMLARCSISPRSAWPTMTRTKRKCFSDSDLRANSQ